MPINQETELPDATLKCQLNWDADSFQSMRQKAEHDPRITNVAIRYNMM